jgi:hypothetical protein
LGRRKRRQGQNHCNGRSETDTSPIHVVLHDCTLVTRPSPQPPGLV